MARQTDIRTITTETWLGADTKWRGTMRFTGSVRISGYYEGQIVATGFLLIAEGAEVKADVRAETIIVGGTVHGNLEATTDIDMLPGCVVYGNVRAARIRIADGVVFDGRCEMLKNSETIDVFSAPLEQLRQQAVPLVETAEK